MRKTKYTKMLRRQRKATLKRLCAKVGDEFQVSLANDVKTLIDVPTAKWEDLITLVQSYINRTEISNVKKDWELMAIDFARCTCSTCGVLKCRWRWDFYNVDGDCLAIK